MDSSSTVLPIRDDSHARAVVKRELYRAWQWYCDKIEVAGWHLPKSRPKRFRQLAERLSHALEPCVVEAAYFGAGKGKCNHYYITSLEGFARGEDPRYWPVNQRVLPCRTTRLDSKRLRIIEDQDYCFVSVHVLERLARRSQCRTMQQMLNTLRPYLVATVLLEHGGGLEGMGEFVLVGENGYVPGRRCEESGKPVLLTWMPRSLWSNAKVAKLNHLANWCGRTGKIVPVHQRDFGRSWCLDPARHGVTL